MTQHNQKARERSGQCLCGAVRITASAAGDAVCACHCKMCLRWGGGPFMEVECGDSVDIEGEEQVTVYSSSDWAERGFCAACGTHLFYRLKETQQHMIPIGFFGDDDSLVFAKQVFVDERPHYYRFADKTAEMTGAECFAAYGEPG